MFGFHAVYLKWLKQTDHRFVGWFGRLRGAQRWTRWFKGGLRELGYAHRVVDTSELTTKVLRAQRILLVEPVDDHQGLVSNGNMLQRLLETSGLTRIRR
jgi:hypothetical protein